MNKKIKKSLYLPKWIVEVLDSEGEIYDGPGVTLAVMIYDFSQRKKQEKLRAIQNYRAKEAALAYDEAAADVRKAAKQSKRPEPIGRPVKRRPIRTEY